MSDFKVGVGDDITINGKIVEYDARCDMVCYRMNDGTEQWTSARNINTIRPYKDPPKDDKRRGN